VRRAGGGWWTGAQRSIESQERCKNDTDQAQAAPSHAAASMRLAIIYEKQGDKAKAKGRYEASLKDDPEMELAKKGLKRLR